MEAKDTIKDVAAFLWDILTEERGGGPAPASEPNPIECVASDPYLALTEAGHEGITQEELLEAIELLANQLNAGQAGQAAELQALRTSVEQLPSQIVTDAPPPAAPITHVTQKHVTVVKETQQVTNEGDTNIDNRVLTEINSRGDVTFDQDVNVSTAVADDGGVAIGGDLEDSAVNTGINTGVVAGDDAVLVDSIVGDNNDQVNDTRAGAVSTDQGDATNAQGENVNLGSGALTDVDAGGDAAAVTGDQNDVTGDVALEVSTEAPPPPAPEPIEVAVPVEPATPALTVPEMPKVAVPVEPVASLVQDIPADPLTELPAFEEPVMEQVEIPVDTSMDAAMDVALTEDPAALLDDGLE